MTHNDTELMERIALLETSVRELESRYFSMRNGELYRNILDVVEKILLEAVLEKTFGNQLKAAKILGINRNTLRSKIKRYQIHVDRWRI